MPKKLSNVGFFFSNFIRFFLLFHRPTSMSKSKMLETNWSLLISSPLGAAHAKWLHQFWRNWLKNMQVLSFLRWEFCCRYSFSHLLRFIQCWWWYAKYFNIILISFTGRCGRVWGFGHAIWNLQHANIRILEEWLKSRFFLRRESRQTRKDHHSIP